jgi:hypothetical protein
MRRLSTSRRSGLRIVALPLLAPPAWASAFGTVNDERSAARATMGDLREVGAAIALLEWPDDLPASGSLGMLNGPFSLPDLPASDHWGRPLTFEKAPSGRFPLASPGSQGVADANAPSGSSP